MIAGVHYEDEQFVELLEGDPESDPHLTSCGSCRERLDSFRIVASALHDSATWDERALDEKPVPATIANLRAFADRMTAEDTQADLVLRQILAGPRETWTSVLEHRTAGMVRKLIEASERAIDTMPPDAVHLATLATDVAATLPADTYPSDTIPRLRGAAWRERAYALFYTGAFADAEQAIFTSESHLSDCLVDEYEKARLGIVRALVDRGLEKYTSAIESARTSARSFDAFENEAKAIAARLAEVHLLFSTGALSAAYLTLAGLEKQLRGSADLDSYARVLANLGNCCWRLGRVADALLYHNAAAVLFAELGVESEAVREQWNVARVFAYEGRFEEAMPRFRSLQTEFDRLGMTASATQVSLDIAEILVTQGEYREVEGICQAAMSVLEQARLVHTAPSLTALGLMKEAAANRSATPALVRQVREYLVRVPRQPELLFAFPPS